MDGPPEGATRDGGAGARASRRGRSHGGTATEHRSEAAILAEVLRTHHGVPARAVALEERSTRCGQSAELSLEVVRTGPGPVRSILLVQDPTTQRRTHACFERHWRDSAGTAVVSHAPFGPVVGEDSGESRVADPAGRTAWSPTRAGTPTRRHRQA
ncbi:YdcF family protein [Kineococcus indalonis]|uniref:YdcF family protein n=1 Tax=Kineococcus indalonis TaxID=2696566 RepID=UPI0023F2BD52|nr:YdcF family protein [Kineococcus indalonis]